MSLVPDYDDSDESNLDNSDNATENQKTISSTNLITDLLNKKETLPSASFIFSGQTKPGEVFHNPFKAAEKAKLDSLEKHVKMVNSDDNIKSINGKKICWNYRKGRCRFGSKCTYAHDSDIHKSDELPITDNSIHLHSKITDALNDTIEIKEIELNEKNKNTFMKKKRVGLGNSIIPSKKVMKSYNSQRNFKI